MHMVIRAIVYAEEFGYLAGNVPKSIWHRRLDSSLKHLEKAISDLEERMAKEHPDKWSTDVFYEEESLSE